MILVAVYTCDSCSTEVFQPVNTQQFTPLLDCPYQTCKSKNMRGTLQHQTKSSKFVEYQSVVIQELPEEVKKFLIFNFLILIIFYNFFFNFFFKTIFWFFFDLFFKLF